MTDPFQRPQLPPTPNGFKVWFVFVALVVLALLGLGAWAVIKLVNHFT